MAVLQITRRADVHELGLETLDVVLDERNAEMQHSVWRRRAHAREAFGDAITVFMKAHDVAFEERRCECKHEEGRESNKYLDHDCCELDSTWYLDATRNFIDSRKSQKIVPGHDMPSRRDRKDGDDEVLCRFHNFANPLAAMPTTRSNINT